MEVLSFQVFKTLAGFWKPSVEYAPEISVVPQAAAASAHATRIVGLSKLVRTQTDHQPLDQIVHIFKTTQTLDCMLTKIFPKSSRGSSVIKACCLDVSKTGEEVYLAGLENRGNQILPVVHICKFDFYLPILQTIELSSSMGILNIQKLRRMEQNNNFIAACDRHMMIYDLDNKRCWRLMDVLAADIQDFSQAKDTIVMKAVDDGEYKMVKIEDGVKELLQELVIQQPATPKDSLSQNQAALIHSGLTSPTNNPAGVSPVAPAYQPAVSSVHTPPNAPAPNPLDASLRQPQRHNTDQPNRSISPSPQLTSPKKQKAYKRPAAPTIYSSSRYEGYNLFKVLVPGSGSLEKLAVNKHMTKIICSGSKVFILEDPSKPGHPIESADFESRLKTSTEIGTLRSPDKRVFSIKATPSHHLIVHEDVTNDLVIIDMSGKEITRYKARGKFKFSTLGLTSIEPPAKRALHRRERTHGLVLRRHLDLQGQPQRPLLQRDQEGHGVAGQGQRRSRAAHRGEAERPRVPAAVRLPRLLQDQLHQRREVRGAQHRRGVFVPWL